jgi:hypothetical protein
MRVMRATVAVLWLGLTVAGCGGTKQPRLYPATGTVTWNGEPLAGATVSFVPAVGAPSDGTTDSAGKYAIMTNGQPGAPLGANKVTVSKFTGSVTMPSAPTPDDMMKMAIEKGKKKGVDKGEIPVKFNRPDTSGLNADVKADAAENVFNFDLKD